MRYSPFILRAPASSAELGKAKPLQLLKKTLKTNKIGLFHDRKWHGMHIKTNTQGGGKILNLRQRNESI